MARRNASTQVSKWALYDVYEETDVARSGPIFKGATPDHGALRVSFTEVTGGLSAKNELTGFAIAAADGPWVNAQARIEGEMVVVSSPQISAPTRVRYAWGTNPACTLYNGAGLPASPFGSDE